MRRPRRGEISYVESDLGRRILLSLCACDQAKQEETVAAISGRFMIVSAGSYYNAKDAANVSGGVAIRHEHWSLTVLYSRRRFIHPLWPNTFAFGLLINQSHVPSGDGRMNK